MAAGIAAVTAAIVIIRAAAPAGGAPARADLAGAAGGASAGAAAAAGDRVQAAAWIARQVSGSAVVGCDPAMCAALRTRGVPAGGLLAIGPDGQSDPLGCTIVVATAAIRGALGARLTHVYAPLVLAQFGSGSARIEVRAIAPDGSRAYLQALRADEAARWQAGQQLLADRDLSEAPAARRELARGQVDTRLLTTIAALAAGWALRITAFGAAGPGASPRVPRPSADIAVPGAGSAGSCSPCHRRLPPRPAPAVPGHRHLRDPPAVRPARLAGDLRRARSPGADVGRLRLVGLGPVRL